MWLHNAVHIFKLIRVKLFNGQSPYPQFKIRYLHSLLGLVFSPSNCLKIFSILLHSMDFLATGLGWFSRSASGRSALVGPFRTVHAACHYLWPSCRQNIIGNSDHHLFRHPPLSCSFLFSAVETGSNLEPVHTYLQERPACTFKATALSRQQRVGAGAGGNVQKSTVPTCSLTLQAWTGCCGRRWR